MNIIKKISIIVMFFSFFISATQAEELISKKDYSLLMENFTQRLTTYVGDAKSRFGSIVKFQENECVFEGTFYKKVLINGSWENERLSKTMVNLKEIDPDILFLKTSFVEGRLWFIVQAREGVNFKSYVKYSDAKKSKDQYLYRDQIELTKEFSAYTPSIKEAESMARQFPLMINYCQAKN